MSQVPGQGEVGRLHVTISADGVSQTQAELRKVGDEGEKAAQRTGNAFKDFGKALKEPVEAVKRITGSLLGAVGVAATFYQLGQRIRESFNSAADEAERFINALGDAGPEQRIKAIQDQVDSLNSKIAQVRSAWYQRLLGLANLTTEAGMTTERDILLQSMKAARDQLAAQQARKKAKEEEAEEQAYADKEQAARDKKARDEAEAGAKKQAELFDKLVGQYEEEREAREKRITAEREKQLNLLKQEARAAEEARKSLRAAFDADTLSADLGRITELLQALVAQRR